MRLIPFFGPVCLECMDFLAWRYTLRRCESTGHISDTYAVNSLSAPSMVNFGIYTYSNSSVSGEKDGLTETDKADWFEVESEGIITDTNITKHVMKIVFSEREMQIPQKVPPQERHGIMQMK